MKVEVNTSKNSHSQLGRILIPIFFTISLYSLFSISISLFKISRNSEIKYLCDLYLVQNSESKLNKIIKIIGIKNKNKVWNFCLNFNNIKN